MLASAGRPTLILCHSLHICAEAGAHCLVPENKWKGHKSYTRNDQTLKRGCRLLAETMRDRRDRRNHLVKHDDAAVFAVADLCLRKITSSRATQRNGRAHVESLQETCIDGHYRQQPAELCRSACHAVETSWNECASHLNSTRSKRPFSRRLKGYERCLISESVAAAAGTS